MTRAALLLCLLAACDGPSSSTPPGGGGPSTATKFRISVMNACSQDLLVKLSDSPQSDGRQQILNKNMRDTITGTTELVHLLGASGEVLYTYRPVDGDQKATISSDCTAMTRDG
jgi:hypothetical protein